MFLISKVIELDAGHRVPFHNSKCRNIHGHRYRVQLSIKAHSTISPDTKSSESGMVKDFGFLKQVLMEEVHDPFDHKLILWEKDPLLEQIAPICWEISGQSLVVIPVIPTAEELAKYWGRCLVERLQRTPGEFAVHNVIVKETPTSLATWTPLA